MTLKEAIESGKPFKLPNHSDWKVKGLGKLFLSFDEITSNEWITEEVKTTTKLTFKHVNIPDKQIKLQETTLAQHESNFELLDNETRTSITLDESIKTNTDSIGVAITHYDGFVENPICLLSADYKSIPYIIILLNKYLEYKQNKDQKFVSVIEGETSSEDVE